MTPKVSIIIPVYNSEKHLRECIESVLHQNYDNYELIIIDDGSSDKSRNICSVYEFDPHVRIINKTNGGVSSARNLGLEEARGEWIMFLDSDDVLFSSAIAKCVDLVTTFQVDFLQFSYTRDYLCIDNSFIAEKNIIVNNVDFLNAIHHNYYVWCCFIKKKIIDTYSIRFDEKLRIAEDCLFIVACVSASNKLLKSNIELYYYRDNDCSAMHNVKTAYCVDTIIEAIEYKKKYPLFRKSIDDVIMDMTGRILTNNDYSIVKLSKIVSSSKIGVLNRSTFFLKLIAKVSRISLWLTMFFMFLYVAKNSKRYVVCN